MSPAAIAAIISLVQEIIVQEPKIAAALKEIFTKENPTPDDWLLLRAAVSSESYEVLVPSSKIPSDL